MDLIVNYNDKTSLSFTLINSQVIRNVKTEEKSYIEIQDNTSSKELYSAWQQIKTKGTENVSSVVINQGTSTINIENIKEIGYNITFNRFVSEYLIFKLQ